MKMPDDTSWIKKLQRYAIYISFVGMLFLIFYKIICLRINQDIIVEISPLDLVNSEAQEIYQERRRLFENFCNKYSNDPVLESVNHNLRFNDMLYFDY